MLGVFGVMTVGRNATYMGDTSIGLRQEIIRAYLTMDKELRGSRPSLLSIGVGTTSASLTFKMPQDVDGDGSYLNSTGGVEWSGNITYALNAAGQITRVSSNVTKILANNITSLLFTRPTTPVDILQIDVTAQKQSLARRTLQDSAQIKIKMRN
jgi:hypothetical protein